VTDGVGVRVAAGVVGDGVGVLVAIGIVGDGVGLASGVIIRSSGGVGVVSGIQGEQLLCGAGSGCPQATHVPHTGSCV
jgi:hypothetical protein